MHDLNDALDDLRQVHRSSRNAQKSTKIQVLPYARERAPRRLSKIVTLLLARNYILLQVHRFSCASHKNTLGIGTQSRATARTAQPRAVGALIGSNKSSRMIFLL